MSALDYRQNYHMQPHFQGPRSNPLSTGQMLMIGAGALALGGLGYWVYAKRQEAKATTPPETVTNPGYRRAA